MIQIKCSHILSGAFSELDLITPMQTCALGNLLPLLVALALAACDRPPKTEANVQYYHARGIVRGFAPDRSTVEIEHEAIPGFMPAMTMPFAAREAKEIANLQRGDAVSFRIAVTPKEAWIAEVQKIAATDVHLPAVTPPPSLPSISQRLREGDAVPAFQLINESGAPITQESFRGQPWIVTFIFTRCPIPNFCPRMMQNFSALQKAIKAGELPHTRLLGITLDPEFDTPEILKAYGRAEGADPQTWNFATGNPSAIADLTKGFAVYRQSESGTINHGLATALIDREGKIANIWRGNSWTTEEVLAAFAALDSTATTKTSPE